MKKIAADRNYRLLKSSWESQQEQKYKITYVDKSDPFDPRPGETSCKAPSEAPFHQQTGEAMLASFRYDNDDFTDLQLVPC